MHLKVVYFLFQELITSKYSICKAFRFGHWFETGKNETNHSKSVLP